MKSNPDFVWMMSCGNSKLNMLLFMFSFLFLVGLFKCCCVQSSIAQDAIFICTNKWFRAAPIFFWVFGSREIKSLEGLFVMSNVHPIASGLKRLSCHTGAFNILLSLTSAKLFRFGQREKGSLPSVFLLLYVSQWPD